MEQLEALIGPELTAAFAEKGYASLTAVQTAVLEPNARGRDLRITSQTGSGKTVAVGLALREVMADGEGIRALMVAPTRELAKQVEQELAWLFSHLGLRVASVTGGASYTDERRALAGKPAIVVATPGRLLDHLERGTVNATNVRAVVLDEADRLLDMGFREDLEKIFSFTPEERRTHLVSATFPREVLSLANSVQHDPVHVEGTRLGVANTDIEHIIHLVDSRDRLAALVNLLLSEPDGQTLVFARTRADVADISDALLDAGFAVRPLSGEMQQRERERALAAFKRGELHALIATDVAARGIDVQDVARVIQMEPPTDADTYTHRSGRTGRAGRKGESILMVVPPALARARFLLRRAGVTPRFAPIPTAEDIRAAAAERVFTTLTGPDPEGFTGFDEHTWQLAKRLESGENVARTIARMLQRTHWSGSAEPREVRHIPPPQEEKIKQAHPARRDRSDREWVSFRVSWGREQGAEPRRLLAMVCRRGGIESADVGSIRVAAHFSTVDVASDVAEAFATAAANIDTRDERVTIRRDRVPTRPTTRDREPTEHVERPAPPVERPAYAERPPHRAERPAPRAERPAPRAERPAPRAERPAPRAERPAPRAERPAPRAERPAPERYGAERPYKRADAPAADPRAKPRGKPTHPKPAHHTKDHKGKDAGGDTRPRRPR